MKRILGLSAALGAALSVSTPAYAQFFFKPPNFHGEPVRGDEPGLGFSLPGATDTERNAALVWGLRAALNVAALQCQFEPSLVTVESYNALLKDHAGELKTSYDILGKYFARTVGGAAGKAAKGKAPPASKAAVAALEKFNTRTYTGFSAVASQYTFCQTASSIATDVTLSPRGTLLEVAQNRMRELRNSLVPTGEQHFPGRVSVLVTMPILPRMDSQCWKKDSYQANVCGPAYY